MSRVSLVNVIKQSVISLSSWKTAPNTHACIVIFARDLCLHLRYVRVREHLINKCTSRAMFTRDRFQTDPKGSGPKMGSDRPSVYMGPFWNRSGTDPNGSKTGPAFLQIQFWIHLDPFRTGSRTVPCKQKLIWFGSVRNGSSPIPCKCSLIH